MPDPAEHLLFGYLVKDFLTTAAEVERSRSQLISFAKREGFRLEVIFVEEASPVPAAFAAMLARSKLDQVNAVVVLSEDVLAARTPSGLTRRQQLEQETTARVLVVKSPP